MTFVHGHEEARRELLAVLGSNQDAYEAVRVRAMLSRNETGWVNYLCMVRAYPRGDVPVGERSHTYGSVRLVESWLHPADLLDFLDGIAAGELRLERPIPLTMGRGLMFLERLSCGNWCAEEAGYHFATDSPSGWSYRLEEPLVAYTGPCFPDGYAAIQSWVGVPVFRDSAHGWLPRVMIFLPECRARFKRLTHSGRTLSLTCAFGAEPIPDLRIRGVWMRAGQLHQIDRPLTGSRVRIGLPMDAESIHLFLIAPDGTTYDHHREESTWLIGRERVLGAAHRFTAAAAALRRALTTGEGPHAEFKPFINPNHEKADELVRTAIAFANTGGGWIFLGLDKNCMLLVGIEADVVPAYPKCQNSLQRALDIYEAHLLRRISDAVNRPIAFDMKRIQYATHTILAIHVAEGREKPYATLGSEAIYVRRGASNVFPQVDNELPHLVDARRGLPPPPR
jgi:Putative DNA-binding domain